MTTLPPALDAMAQYAQWINWQLVQRPGKPKPDKVPTDPLTRIPIDAQNPSSWMTAEAAVASARDKKLGVGFVFTERDPFFFLDIDACGTEDPSRPWSDLAYHLISLLPGAAVETSVSGRGLHVFGRCPGVFLHGKKNTAHHIELYTEGRFAAIGHGAEGDSNTMCPGILSIASQYFPPPPDISGMWTAEAQPGSGIADDDALIEKALVAKSAASVFSDKASFKDLWEANDLALAATYPDPNRAYDASSADLAMASHLAFWTGGNCEQIARLMRRSALARDKWEREDYFTNTILKAIGGMGDVYRSPTQLKAQDQARIDEAIAEHEATPPATPPPPPPPGPPPAANSHVPDAPAPTVTAIKESYPYVPPLTAQELFEKYVYVLSLDRLVSPKGDLLSQSQFRTSFRNHSFALTLGTNKTTTNAWKAYMEAEYLNTPQADRVCFRPGDTRRFIPDGDDNLANIWRDPKPRRVKGDPTPFVNHVRSLLPDEGDAEQVLAYLAACVQHQGTKFAWCPLIQGVQGNGKSMLGKVVAQVIGEKYVHTLRTDSVRSQFNGWVQGHTLILVEDLHLNGSMATLEMIKPLITADRMPVERKGCDQVTEDVCCNFLMTTNHKDAIPLDPDERRWAVFCCAQQTKADVNRSGLTNAYFDAMWRWLKDEDGYAIVADYLWNYVIPEEMNPAALCTTAPETSTHHVALEASRSPAAQFLDEATQTDAPGFRDGWMSSVAAMNLLRENRLPATPQKVAVEISKLGYVRHPGLPDGKPTRNISGEGKRSRLWVKEGHPSWHLQGEAVMRSYEAAQGYAPVGNVVPLRQ